MKIYRRNYIPFIICVSLAFILVDARPANAQLTELSGVEHGLYHLHWSSDGTKLCGTYQNNGVYGLGIIDVENQISELLDTGYNYGDFYNSWSPDGTQIAFNAIPGSGASYIYLFNMNNQNSTLLTAGMMPSWSPDGLKIAFSGNGGINTISAAGGTPRKITSFFGTVPCWSPDGKNILFTSDYSGNSDIWIVPSSGGTPSQLTFNSSEDTHGWWSPDSKHIAFESQRSGNRDIWILTLENMELNQFTASQFEEGDPAWSPDGTKIAFVSNRSGEWSIWLKETDILTGIEPEHQVIPNILKLHQNYPNPFNPVTTISYDLFKPSQVELFIYDIRGRLVKSLVLDFQPAGSYSITWNGKTDEGKQIASSGVYFYRIKSGSSLITKKMFLLK